MKNKINFIRNKEYIRNIICILLFFTFIFFIYILHIKCFYANLISDHYNMTSYLITYKNGFISRGFIGTLYSIIPLNKFLSIMHILSLIYVTIIFIFILKNIISVLIKTFNNVNLTFLYVFMMTSSSIIYFTLHHYNTKLEIFWYLLFIPVFYSFLNLKKYKMFKVCMIFIFSIISVLIHQGFVFILMPFIMILFWEENEKKICIFYMFIVGIIFLICQFLGKGNAEEIWYNVENKMLQLGLNDLEHATFSMKKMIYLEYKLKITEHFKILMKGFININLKMFLSILIINIANIFCLIYLMISIFGKKLKLYIPFILASQIPLYVLTIDYDRWILLLMLNCQLLITYKLRKVNDINKIKIIKPNIIFVIIFLINLFGVLYGFLFV